MTTITFRGNESTGSVADRKIDTACNESTGSVGVRTKQGSIFSVDNEPERDVVSFRGRNNEQNKTLTAALMLGSAAALFGMMGLAHKYDWVSKIKNDKVKEFFRHTDVVTKPCHEACAWLKHNTYDPIVKFFKGK